MRAGALVSAGYNREPHLHITLERDWEEVLWENHGGGRALD